jgi:3-phenylpropionate/cinnamic acid dioxygenase small subunit
VPDGIVDPTDRALAVELLARYAEAIDAGAFDRVGQLFADAELLGPDGSRIAAGAEQVRALYESMTRRHDDGTPLTAHLVTNAIVDRLGEDELEVRSRFVVLQATESLPLQPVVVGRYRDRLVRSGHGWRFRSRQMLPELWGDVSEHLLSAVEGV